MPSSNVYAVYQDRLGYMWFGSKGGVSRFDGNQFQNFQLTGDFVAEDIIKIYEYDKKLCFISNKGHHFYYKKEQLHFVEHPEMSIPIDYAQENWKDHIKSETIKNFIDTHEITDQFLDYDGSCWFTTVEKGVYYFPNYSFINTLDKSEPVYSLNRYDDQIFYNGKLNDLNLKLRMIGNKGFSFIKDDLYYNEGLVYANKGHFLNVSSSDILQIKKYKNIIYLLLTENRLYKIDSDLKTQELIFLDKLMINDFSISINGALYLATNEGIYTIHDKELIKLDQFELLNRRISKIRSSAHFDLIALSSNNQLIFKKDITVFTLGEKEELNTGLIKDLYLDSNDNIWLETNRGVFKLDKENPKEHIHFSTKNGLLSNDINDVLEVDRIIYVGSAKGLNTIDIDNFKPNTKPPKIFIQYVRLDNEKFSFPNDTIQIKPKYSYLTISYLGINYKLKGDTNYKYKIDGIHNKWIETKDQKVQFTTLPSKGGTYVFEVMAQNEDGVWSKPHQFTMIFLIPFYKTWWFITLMIITSLAVVLLLIRNFYRRKIKAQKIKSELAQLEGKALQSQMNPHFVFNALNSIQSFVTTGDTLKSEIYLAKFSSLLRKTLSNSRENTIELSKEIESLTMYLELEKMRFEEKLSYHIHIDEDVEQDFIQVPPMLIQPFVENAILHGISPKKEGGKVVVTLKMKGDDMLHCVVSDDGVGRKIKKNPSHKSLGTSIVKKRLSIISNIENAEIKYTDLKDLEDKPIGTKVEFVIPV